VLAGSDENIIDVLLRDVYQGRFLTRRELSLPASPIRAEKCHRQRVKDREQALSSPAVHRSSGAAKSSSGETFKVFYQVYVAASCNKVYV